MKRTEKAEKAVNAAGTEKAETEVSTGLPAYFTVEASFLVPAVLVLFVLVIYLGFFLYDRCLYTQDAYIICFRESIRKNPDEGGSSKEHMLQEKTRQFGTKYFAVTNASCTAEEKNGSYFFSGNAEVIPAVFRNSAYMPADVFPLRFEGRARKNDPPEGIRYYVRIRDLIRTGYDFLKSNNGADKESEGNE